MSATDPSTRRLAIAIATAAASVTVAIGVTAASLLGWFRPDTGRPVVPVPPATEPLPAPEAVEAQLAMDRPYVREHDDHREHGRDHDEHEDDDDDDDD